MEGESQARIQKFFDLQSIMRSCSLSEDYKLQQEEKNIQNLHTEAATQTKLTLGGILGCQVANK